MVSFYLFPRAFFRVRAALAVALIGSLRLNTLVWAFLFIANELVIEALNVDVFGDGIALHLDDILKKALLFVAALAINLLLLIEK